MAVRQTQCADSQTAFDKGGSSVSDPVGQDPDGGNAPIPSREWIKALIFVTGTAVLVIGLLIWFSFTFVVQSCDAVPACG